MVLKIENIVKTFEVGGESFNALNDINFDVKKGEFITICGPSGSGKSTLFNIIAGFEKPTSGQVFLNGKCISDIAERNLAKIRMSEFGVVFQSFCLLPELSTLENVMMPLLISGKKRRIAKDKAAKYLDMVGLKDKYNSKPHQLSGGQLQRIAIARAIVNEPSILLADEPTGNLDSTNSKLVIDLLKKINVNTSQTILLITHSREIAEGSKRLINICDGRVTDDRRCEE